MSTFSNPLTEFSPQLESVDLAQTEYLEYPRAGVFSDGEEMALASELLEVRNEQELDHFLGSLLRGAAKAVGKVISSPVGKAVGGLLKTAAKVALPAAGGVVGAALG